jgi:hypothetical protein
MKILIKAHGATYALLDNMCNCNHVGGYWNFLHYNCFKQLGYEVAFYGSTEVLPKIVNNHVGFDILFCRGYNGIRYEHDFLVEGLKTFRGKKILYLEGGDENDIGQYFDVVLVPELGKDVDKWKARYPQKDIRLATWPAAEVSFMDANVDSPYPDDKFRIIYTGIFTQRFLDDMIKLANLGEYIVLGGIYYDGKQCRGFTKEERTNLPTNIQVISDNGIFNYGVHFPYLRHADLALGFYAYSFEGSLSSKLIEYLNFGLPVVCEDTVPNRNRVKQYDAGTIVKWGNFEDLYAGIQKEKEMRRNKGDIMTKARAVHDPMAISRGILL